MGFALDSLENDLPSVFIINRNRLKVFKLDVKLYLLDILDIHNSMVGT